jgi:hypothetical protein
MYDVIIVIFYSSHRHKPPSIFGNRDETREKLNRPKLIEYLFSNCLESCNSLWNVATGRGLTIFGSTEKGKISSK